MLPLKYTCFGEGVSPPLHLEGFSDSVRAFALTFGDGNKCHWLVYYIDGSLRDIPEKAQEGESLRFGINDFGKRGYTPPCPTKKKLYRFTLFALSDVPSFRGSPTERELLEAIENIKLGESHLLCYVIP
ncbi:YbhB/YbcL family Raf kinase inhibitor-like protein [Aquifex sp.]